MRKKCFFLLLLLFPAMSHAGNDPSTYYPLTEGSRWVYKITDLEAKNETFEQVVTVEKPELFEKQRYHILQQKDKRGSVRSFILSKENGVFWKKIGARKAFTPEATTEFTPELPIMQFPLQKGKTWDWAGSLKIAWINKKIKMHCQVVEDNEELTTPAGTFRCVKIYIHQTRDKEVSEEYGWYAAGVGQIKYQTKRTLKVLQSYQIKQ